MKETDLKSLYANSNTSTGFLFLFFSNYPFLVQFKPPSLPTIVDCGLPSILWIDILSRVGDASSFCNLAQANKVLSSPPFFSILFSDLFLLLLLFCVIEK
jgi:hypothetical protein